MLQNGINHAEPLQVNRESGRRNDCEDFLQRQSKESSLHVQNLGTVEKDNLSSNLGSTAGCNTVKDVEAEGRLEDWCRKFKCNSNLNETGSVRPIPSRELDQLRYLNVGKCDLDQTGKESRCAMIRIKVEEHDVELSDNNSVTDRLSRESIHFENSSKGRDMNELGEGRVEERHIKSGGGDDDLNEIGHDGEVLSRETNRCVDFNSGSRDLNEVGDDGSKEKRPKEDVTTSKLTEEIVVSERLIMTRMRLKSLRNLESVGMMTSYEGGQKEPYKSSNVKQFEYEDDASGIIGGFLEDDSDDDDDVLVLDHYEHYNGTFIENAKDHDSQVIVALCCLFTRSTSFFFTVAPVVPKRYSCLKRDPQKWIIWPIFKFFL